MEYSQFCTLSVTLPPYDRDGMLGLPAAAPHGVVLFVHGSGGSRLGSRNSLVAEALQQAGFATLMFDLLTEREAANRTNVFDIPLLADRLDQAVDWLDTVTAGQPLPIGFFGANTGAAAALVAAAARKDVRAIVAAADAPIWRRTHWTASRRRRC